MLAIAHDEPDWVVWDRSMTLLADGVMPRLERLERLERLIGQLVAV